MTPHAHPHVEVEYDLAFDAYYCEECVGGWVPCAFCGGTANCRDFCRNEQHTANEWLYWCQAEYCGMKAIAFITQHPAWYDEESPPTQRTVQKSAPVEEPQLPCKETYYGIPCQCNKRHRLWGSRGVQ